GALGFPSPLWGGVRGGGNPRGGQTPRICRTSIDNVVLARGLTPAAAGVLPTLSLPHKEGGNGAAPCALHFSGEALDRDPVGVGGFYSLAAVQQQDGASLHRHA